eukprot:TRINITY_DN93301_c0_g1_i1.p1 TRINITY_DN93301_c0_g1~~TRINITY_DN93301_c0_g1_i1.p1  ORF type:complete len:515 (-),score=74.44 TRINITY_DN93301_c0_g1_i1:129-1673(-)
MAFQRKKALCDLGNGVFWVCCATSDDIKLRLRGSGSMDLSWQDALAMDKEVSEALQRYADSSGGGKVRILFPEVMEHLEFLAWTGDGHYNMKQFAGDRLPTLGHIVSFLRMLDAAAEVSKATVIISSGIRQGAGALLAGANLVLRRGITATDAWAHIVESCDPPSPDPAEAWDKFPPPFSRSGTTSSSSLTVLDCMMALQFATDRHWMKDYRAFDLEVWKFLREKFDATWIIPGEILAVANPWGTSQNPRFPGLLEPSSPKSPKTGRSFSQSTGSPSSSSPRLASSQAGSPTGSQAFLADIDYDIAVEDEVELNGAVAREWEMEFDMKVETLDTTALNNKLLSTEEIYQLSCDSFVSLFRRKGIHGILRLNYNSECPDQVNSEQIFSQSGFEMLATPFDDGDIPPKQTVEAFHKTCKNASHRRSATVVHCMGGLGRTGVLIGTHAVSRHEIPGTAFHGWARMCRPGSVQTAKQEMFLRSLVRKKKTSSFNDMISALRARVPSFNDMLSSSPGSP